MLMPRSGRLISAFERKRTSMNPRKFTSQVEASLSSSSSRGQGPKQPRTYMDDRKLSIELGDPQPAIEK